jgi:hypothetical protein
MDKASITEAYPMIAYKLCRIKQNGAITPLHINRTQELPLGEWLYAGYHPTKGFAERIGWHCGRKPSLPHMKEDVDFENRVWVEVEIKDYTTKDVPHSQGDYWYLAGRIKHINILTPKQVEMILHNMEDE